MSKIIDKFRSQLDLSIGLIQTCTFGNYPNFLLLLEKINPPEKKLFEIVSNSNEPIDINELFKTACVSDKIDIIKFLFNK